MGKTKRILSFFIALIMVLALVPFNAIVYAVDVETGDEAQTPSKSEPLASDINTEDAFLAALEKGSVVLGGNITLSKPAKVAEGKTATIDLNGYALTVANASTTYAIANMGTLTIKDSVGTGSVTARGIYNGYDADSTYNYNAKLTIESGTFNAVGENGGAAVFNYGVAELNGGKYTSVGSYSLNTQAGKMTIGKNVVATGGLYNASEVIVNGASISGTRSGCHTIYNWNAKLTVNGGDFYNYNSGNSTIMAAGTSNVEINGGTFGIKDGRVPGNGNTWTSCLTDTQNTASLVVNGGTFNGGFRVQGGTTMTINGGTFNDVGGSGYNVYNGGVAVVNGGTFEDAAAQSFAKKYVAEGLSLNDKGEVVDADGNVVAKPELPTATVAPIQNNSNVLFGLTFSADSVTAEQLEAYGDYFADFVITFNKDLTLGYGEGTDGWLSGNYGDYGWVNVPTIDKKISVEANKSYRVMDIAAELLGKDSLHITYDFVVKTVQEFQCGVYLTPEFVAENPDFGVEIGLSMFEPVEDANDNTVLGEEIKVECTDANGAPMQTIFKNEDISLELPSAKVYPVVNPDLSFGLTFEVNKITDAQLDYYGDWYADFTIEFDVPGSDLKEIVLGTGEGADGWLSGQYDEWSENWVNVPFENKSIPLNEPIKVMDFAAKLMGKDGLKITYREVYEGVEKFNCGVYLTPEFIEANGNFTVAVDLAMFEAVVDENGNVTEVKHDVVYTDKGGNVIDKSEVTLFDKDDVYVAAVAQIGDKKYTSLQAAIDAAQAGDVITIIADVENEAVTVDKNVTIQGTATLTNLSFNAAGADELTISGLTFKGNSWINSGTAEKLVVSGVTANVTPSNTTYTNSRSAFISLGRNEGQMLDLTIKNCSIVSAGGSNPVLGWACITKANLTGNTFGSASAYQNNSDSVKFMAIGEGAVIEVVNNTVYSNYNGIVFGQNTTRENSYTAIIEGNTFVGSADHIWVEVSDSNTCNGAFNVKGDNTINGNAIKASDIKLHPNVNNFTAYAGVDVVLDENGKIIGGTFVILNEECVADGYAANKNADGTFGIEEKKTYVAMIGENGYETLEAAIAAAKNGDEVVILVAGTYTVPSGKDITITGAVDSVVFDNIKKHAMGGASVTFNNVTFNYLMTEGHNGLQHSGDLVYNNCTFNGQVFLYGTSETFNKCTFNQTDVNNYNVWTYAADDVKFNGCTFYSAGRSLLIYSEGADLYANVVITDCDFISSNAVDGKAAIEMDSSLSAGIKVTIDAATTATGFGNGNVSGNSLWNNKKGNETAANNDITVVVNGVTVLAPVTYVAQIGDKKYTSLQDAINAAQNGETVVLLANIADSATIKIVNKSITIDLAGHTISGTCNAGQDSLIYIENNAALTVKDTVGEGKITYAQGSSNVGWTIDVEGKFVLESGTIELTGSWSIGYAVDVRPNAWGSEYTNPSVFVMNGGAIVSSDGAVRVASSSYDEYKKVSASFVMNDGTIDAAWDGVFIQQSNAAYDVLSFTMNGGTINSDLNPVRVYGPAPTSYVNGQNCMKITLAGGELNYTGTEAYEWVIDGILRVGGGSTVETIVENGTLAVSAEIANSSAAPAGYQWVANSNGTYGISKITVKFQRSVIFGDFLELNFNFLKIEGTKVYAKVIIDHSVCCGGANKEYYVEYGDTKNGWVFGTGGGAYDAISVKNIAAKEMGTNVCVQLFAGTSTDDVADVAISEINVFSIKAYAMTLLNKASSSATTKTAMYALLEYGAAAQIAFGHAKDKLVTNELTDAHAPYKPSNVTTSDAMNVLIGEEYRRACSVTFTNSLEMNLYLKNLSDKRLNVLATYTTYLGTPVTVKLTADDLDYRSDGFVGIKISGISGANINSIVNITVCVEGETTPIYQMEYSIAIYAKTALGTTTDPAKAILYQAVLNYGSCIRAYLETLKK